MTNRRSGKFPLPKKGEVRVAPLGAIPDLLRDFGVTPSPLLKTYGLSEEFFHEPENTLPFEVLGRVLDACARETGCPHFGLLIGQCIGRWGNFVNGEAHGGATSLPWGMSIDGASPVHPTFLYESLWNFVGFLVLHFYSKKRKFKGEMALLYVAW